MSNIHVCIECHKNTTTRDNYRCKKCYLDERCLRIKREIWQWREYGNVSPEVKKLSCARCNKNKKIKAFVDHKDVPIEAFDSKEVYCLYCQNVRAERKKSCPICEEFKLFTEFIDGKNVCQECRALVKKQKKKRSKRKANRQAKREAKRGGKHKHDGAHEVKLKSYGFAKKLDIPQHIRLSCQSPRPGSIRYIPPIPGLD